MSVATSRGIGQYIAVEGHIAILPKRWKGDGTVRGVLFCHGATVTDMMVTDRANYPNVSNLIQSIADAGFPVLSCQLGTTDNWGNTTAISRLTTAKGYLQGAYPASGFGAKAGKVLLMGMSMGGGLCYAWASANPTQVSGMSLLLPVSDLNDFVSNNRGGFAASVNTAYGGAYVDLTDGPTHSPVKMASAHTLDNIPLQVWYSTDDIVVIPATVTATTGAIVPAPSVTALTGAHSDAPIGQIPVSAVIAFLAANAA